MQSNQNRPQYSIWSNPWINYAISLIVAMVPTALTVISINKIYEKPERQTPSTTWLLLIIPFQAAYTAIIFGINYMAVKYCCNNQEQDVVSQPNYQAMDNVPAEELPTQNTYLPGSVTLSASPSREHMDSNVITSHCRPSLDPSR